VTPVELGEALNEGIGRTRNIEPGSLLDNLGRFAENVISDPLARDDAEEAMAQAIYLADFPKPADSWDETTWVDRLVARTQARAALRALTESNTQGEL
jgi:hypothetical protein